MANIFVSSTGSATAPYDTWAKAATDFATAIAATSTGDKVVVDVTNPPADITANTTWTFVSDCSVICSTNSGTSDITPTPMGTSAWFGNASTSYSLTLQGGFEVFIYGLTLRIAGTGNVNISIANVAGHYEWEDCTLWLGTTHPSARNLIGSGSSNVRSYNKMTNLTVRLGNVSQGMTLAGACEIIGGGIDAAGSAPSGTFFNSSNSQNADYNIIGFDFSPLTGTLVASHTSCATTYRLIQCKMPASYTVLQTQSVLNKSSAKAWLMDCASGDTHGIFGYYDAFGSVVSDTSIYYTSGAAAQSWKIVTSSACTYNTPFVTPWVSFYNTGTSAITPRFEILRDGSATAFQNDEVWAEFMAKVTSGSVQSTLSRDRMAVAGTAADQAAGAGTGSWTGEGGTAWSGKCDSGSAITPAESGHILGRIAVGEPSTTVYVNPEILTA